MAPNHKRQSLAEGPFDELEMEDPENLGRSIRQMMASSLCSKNSLRVKDATFTINMGHDYDYNILDGMTPDQVHLEFRNHISDVADGLQKLHKEKALDEYFIEQLTQMVYGSNMIEMTGGGIDVTVKLCRAIFEGKEVPEEITERDPEYEHLKLHLLSMKLPCEHKEVLRSRREIFQHAQAARYMIEEVCINGKDLTKNIILEAHWILTQKIDIDDKTPWTYYSGRYRDWAVRCGKHVFMSPVKVPSAMREMLESLESDIKMAKEKGEIDPILLASKYCHRFVNIHPFADGNGRMCRLILNTLLLKYGGGIVSFGTRGDDRQEYLQIAVSSSAAEGSQTATGLDVNMESKHYKQLASFTLRHARENMRKIRQIFSRED
ncbi:hypothetical protein F66182_8764 [Fusarium sp. NRRL 66182]|nr:hypothetical protein F66182_8764 [Fusarium sp. NRRL 66182]